MSRADINEMAEKNSGSIVRAWKETLARLTGGKKDKAIMFYHDVLLNGRVTINLRQENLWRFLIDGVYLNVHGLAKKRAEENKTSVEFELKKELKSWHDRRMAFDNFFESGDDFIYGALNIGGLGATRYKDHCLVLKPKNVEEIVSVADFLSQIVYVKYDTLNTSDYWGPNNSFQPDAFQHDLADEDHNRHLAVIKHGETAANIDSENWPQLLCNDDDYIEAIIICDVDLTIKELEAVRMMRKQHDELFGYIVDFEVDGLSEDLSYRVQTFREILSILGKNGVPLELIDA